MHPVRRNILIRWIGYAVVVLGMGAWIYAGGHELPEFKSTVLQRLAPEKVSLPSEEVTKSIKSAIAVLKGEKATFASVETIEQTLIKPRLGGDTGPGGQSGMPGVRISALFLGPPDKYAILNGVAYKEGAQLADGRTLKAIKRDSVVLALGDAEQEVPWVPSFKVELTKPEKDVSVFRPDQDVSAAEGGEEAGAGATGQQVDVDNLPPDLSPDQALQILQQMGNQ